MNAVLTIVLAVQLLSAIAMVVLILLQQGKGADMGAAFGSGASGSLFGASGSANFLSRSTAVLAGLFLVATLTLAYFGNRPAGSGGSNSVLDNLPVPAQQQPARPVDQIPGAATPGSTAPAAPAAADNSVPAPVQTAPSAPVDGQATTK
ncbi:protein translocase subunit secG [Comamonas sp. BIGb0124]|uniref:preprotein translocase subunit SecG n=1 Tax=Comamonas sp. BIGb0124 TaxID=2485130 RepID=UPI000F467011|nr:preprotein translocase subunit SecG [Comamonas sp. BIGb0124]ROR18061.1 protein translocase subunit secG [Comamonas sp. BIGb0124]